MASIYLALHAHYTSCSWENVYQTGLKPELGLHFPGVVLDTKIMAWLSTGYIC